jgi:hypothetical protein
MKPPYSQSWLLQTLVQVLRFFFLGLAGCTVSYVISIVLELNALEQILIDIAENILPKASILVVCLIAVAVITESLRN